MDTTIPLAIVCILGMIGAAWSGWWHNGGCSMVSIPPFRTAGYICVCWTAIMCIIRNIDPISITNNNNTTTNTTATGDSGYTGEMVLYCGYFVIYVCIGGGLAVNR